MKWNCNVATLIERYFTDPARRECQHDHIV